MKPLLACAIHADCLEVYIVSGALKFPEMRRRVEDLGPHLFNSKAVQMVVAELVFGQKLPKAAWDPRQALERDRFLFELRECRVPNTVEWAHHLINLQAERRTQFLLADQLAWASERAREGDPPRWLRERVGDAFAIAMGERAMDPTADWKEVAA